MQSMTPLEGAARDSPWTKSTPLERSETPQTTTPPFGHPLEASPPFS